MKKNSPKIFVLQAFVFGKWTDMDFFRTKEFAQLGLARYTEEFPKARIEEYRKVGK